MASTSSFPAAAPPADAALLAAAPVVAESQPSLAGDLFAAPGLPPPGPDLTSAQIEAHICNAMAARARKEVELQAIKHSLAWLRGLHQKILTRELNARFGMAVDVSSEDEGRAEEGGHVGEVIGGQAEVVAPRPVVAQAAAAPPVKAAAVVAAAKAPQAVPRRRAAVSLVVAPADRCQACFNENRGRQPAVAHSRGKGGRSCRLEPTKASGAAPKRVKAGGASSCGGDGGAAAGAGGAAAGNGQRSLADVFAKASGASGSGGGGGASSGGGGGGASSSGGGGVAPDVVQVADATQGAPVAGVAEWSPDSDEVQQALEELFEAK